MNIYASKELEKLAFDQGFIACVGQYLIGIPLQEIQEFLRVEHKLWCEVVISQFSGMWRYDVLTYKPDGENQWEKVAFSDGFDFDNPNTALSQALTKALQIMKERKDGK